MMMVDERKIAEVYSKTALFINACNTEVTAECMEKLLRELDFPYIEKFAKMFVIPSHKLDEMMMCVSTKPAAVAADPAAAQVETVQDEAPENDAKEPEADDDIDFGDMFGE